MSKKFQDLRHLLRTKDQDPVEDPDLDQEQDQDLKTGEDINEDLEAVKEGLEVVTEDLHHSQLVIENSENGIQDRQVLNSNEEDLEVLSITEEDLRVLRITEEDLRVLRIIEEDLQILNSTNGRDRLVDTMFRLHREDLTIISMVKSDFFLKPNVFRK